LPAKDEEVTLNNICLKESRILDELPCGSNAALNLFLKLFEQRLEAIEVLARLAVSDFFGGTLVGARAHVTKFPDVGCTGRPFQLCQQFIFVHRLGWRVRDNLGSGKKSLL
jgi:hypothetical protein